ncbi:cytochrome c [Chryseobacterium piscicola]|uniref:Cytochrome C n=1 Tax=Chryseobacterium piscicola TaxID=551459 RepID=A0A1N7LDD6_9FLAO|nr:c-type cytochrome [Chryseobacterium piscicola]PQA97543.1 cytochrome C [Chryseobacterium piscicola]SIS71834.1 cytochrome c [Chryseobacterium piscicola]
MKKLIVIGMVSFLAISCSKKEMSQPKSTDPSDVATSVVSNASGQTMIETSDCLACHSIDEKMIGPSYKEIAAKYSEKDIEILASKIIEGGSGVWGDVPMQAHPQFSKEDAKKMVEYILKQKK